MRPKLFTHFWRHVPARCPQCLGHAISKADADYAASHSYKCAACNSILKLSMTPRVLWVFPVLYAFVAAVLLMHSLWHSKQVSGVLFVAMEGCLVVAGFRITMQALFQGFAYRVVKS